MGDLGTLLVGDPPQGGPDAGEPARVAVVFERGPAGEAVLREGAELANSGRLLAVVALAPQARPPRWGRAGGEGPYNIAVREEAALDLRAAREILGTVAGRATFNVLTGCPQPRLAAWVAEHRIGLVLLPRHRLTPNGNFFVKSLRRETSAEVRVIR
jgi:hypothetical protein